MTLQRGFTLIELLVVIAIIGILSSVVLASLNTARNKGSDSSVKSSLANTRAQAELYYDNNTNTYTSVCTGAGGVSNILAGAVKNSADADQIVATGAATAANAAVCNNSAGAWAAEMPLKSTGSYCVDSTGVTKYQAGTTWMLTSATDYVC